MPARETKRKRDLKRQQQRRNTITAVVIIVAFLLVVDAVVVSLGAAPKAAAVPTASLATTLDGKTLLTQRCNDCHSSSYVTRLKGTSDQWAGLVQNMVQKGASLNSQEAKVLAAYLAQTYHP